MKTWKKVASMLMAATMVGSIAACDGGNDDSTPETPPTNTQLATNYADTLNKTLEETKSLKITASVDVTATGRYFGEDGETFDETKTTVEKMAGDFELVLSQDAEGAYSVQMKAEMQQGEGENKQTMVYEAIVVGQYAYTRDYIAENTTTVLWEKADMGVSLNVETLASQMLGMPWADIEYLFNANEFVQMQVSANQALISNLYAMLEAGQITNGAVNASLDITDEVEGWVEYINGIDETTKTVGAFINETAAKLGMPISYDTIVDEIAKSGEKTVADMIDILDTFAEEELGTTLQDLKDEIVNSDFAAKLMEKMQVSADEIEAIKALKIEDLKTQEFATMTVQQLFDEFMASQQPDPATTEEGSEDTQPESAWTSFVQTLVAMKTATMAEMNMILPELPIESVEEVAFTGGLQFNDKGTALTALNFGAGISLNIPIMDSDTGLTQIGVDNADIDFTMTVAEFSTTAVTITAPAADQIEAGE